MTWPKCPRCGALALSKADKVFLPSCRCGRGLTTPDAKAKYEIVKPKKLRKPST